MLKKDIPKEFNRKIRPASNYGNYKAAEHRFYVLYCGPVVLKKMLNEELYNHFLLFHVASRLLSSKEATQYISLSRDYLRRFVENSSMHYGDKFVTLNVNNLVHLPDDVDNIQCNLNDISAFPFESELGKIKNVLLSPHRTLAQYCRRVHEERKIVNQVSQVPQDVSNLKEKKGLVLCLTYKNQYFSSKHPDNTALLKNGKLVKITRIFKTEQKLLNMYEVENINSSCGSGIVSLDDIHTKVIKMNLNFSLESEYRSFAVPLLH